MNVSDLVGWIKNPSDEYHKGPGISSHKLIHAAMRSPLHGFGVDPDKDEDEENEALVFGGHLHSALLEPEEFQKHLRVAPDAPKNTRAGKAEHEAFQATLGPDDTVVSAKHYKAALGMVARAREHKVVQAILQDGVAEMSGYAVDIEFNALRRIRPDWRVPSRGLIVDVKTTENASSWKFSKSIFDYGYHIQAAYYMDTANMIDPGTYNHWVWLVMEKKWPYCVAVYVATDKMLERGRELYRRGLSSLAEYNQTGILTGYPEEVQEIALPQYAYYD